MECGADDAYTVSSSSPWSLVRGYFSFSPATLFLLLNLVIGTIALTSRSHRRRGDDDDDGHQHRHVNDDQQPRHDQYAAAAPPPPPPAPLARTSSVMDRLRSLGLGLYRFRSGDFPPEYDHHLSSPAATHDDATSVMRQDDQAQYARSRSEVKKLERAPKPALVRRAARPAPVPRRLVARVEEEDAAAAARSVDARADDFISKFRQQLQLQRLNSLLNYKEMLSRGV